MFIVSSFLESFKLSTIAFYSLEHFAAVQR